jgi:hypothetical protein
MQKPISSGLLKTVLANALHLPERKVDYPHRVVQEHGEVSRGKRGRGGAGVTPRDAATTIVAVASSFIGDEVIKGVRDISAMPLAQTAYIALSQSPGKAPGILSSQEGSVEVEGGPWQGKGIRLPHLQDLPARHSFVDALTAVIEAARDNAFDAAIREAYPDDEGYSHGIEVVFHGPEPSATISIDLWTCKRRYREETTYFFEQRAATIEQASAFAIDVKIDWQPIYAVATLFREDCGQ